MVRFFPFFVCLLFLSGCVENIIGQEDTGNKTNRFYATPEFISGKSRLIPWTTITGYLDATHTRAGSVMRSVTGVTDVGEFVQPRALGIKGKDLYVVDQYNASLYRFTWQVEGHDDPGHIIEEHEGLSHPQLSLITKLSEVLAPADMYVAPKSGSIFVADEENSKVVQYNEDGGVVNVFASEKYLNRPVAVTVDRREARVFVADAYFDQILVFNMEGAPLYRIGSRGAGKGQFRNLRDMVQGPLGLYILDGMNRKIHIYGLDGTLVSSVDIDQVADGAGITLDNEGRIYVIDRFQSSLAIFNSRGELLEKLGSQGRQPGNFNDPRNLWYFDGYLYVADFGNSRVQVFKVLPEDAYQKMAKEQ